MYPTDMIVLMLADLFADKFNEQHSNEISGEQMQSVSAEQIIQRYIDKMELLRR